jgi:hypothetical protein
MFNARLFRSISGSGNSMYLVIAFFALAVLISTVAAADFQEVPECARPYVLGAIAGFGCSISGRRACYCESDRLTSAFKTDILHYCSDALFDKAFEAVRDICPNLAWIVPPKPHAILDIPDTTDAVSVLPITNWRGAPVATPPAGALKPEQQQPAGAAVAPLENHTNVPQEQPKHTEYHDDVHNDVPVYITPAHFSVEEPSTTVPANDFTNTETWRYPTTTSKILVTTSRKTSPSVTTTQAPPLKGEAAEVNWVRLAGMAVGLGLFVVRVAGILA